MLGVTWRATQPVDDYAGPGTVESMSDESTDAQEVAPTGTTPARQSWRAEDAPFVAQWTEQIGRDAAVLYIRSRRLRIAGSVSMTIGLVISLILWGSASLVLQDVLAVLIVGGLIVLSWGSVLDGRMWRAIGTHCQVSIPWRKRPKLDADTFAVWLVTRRDRMALTEPDPG